MTTTVSNLVATASAGLQGEDVSFYRLVEDGDTRSVEYIPEIWLKGSVPTRAVDITVGVTKEYDEETQKTSITLTLTDEVVEANVGEYVFHVLRDELGVQRYTRAHRLQILPSRGEAAVAILEVWSNGEETSTVTYIGPQGPGGSGSLVSSVNGQTGEVVLTATDVGAAPAEHNHDARYYTEAELDAFLAGKASTGHTHDDRYYTEAELDSLLAGKSDSGHNHDDRYYTEAELDSLLAGKSDSDHNHDGVYVPSAALADYSTTAQVNSLINDAINDLVGASPEDLNQIVELAAALNNNPDFGSEVTAALANRLRVDAAQAFTSQQKDQARSNIGEWPWDEISGKPATFPPDSHALYQHSDFTGLFSYPPNIGAVAIWASSPLGSDGFTLRRLTASDIYSGVFSADRIPTIAQSKVTDLEADLAARLTAREIRVQVIAAGDVFTENDGPVDTEVVVAGTITAVSARANAVGSGTIYLYRVREGVETLVATIEFAATDVAIVTVTPTAIAAGDSLRCTPAAGATDIQDVEITIGVTA